MRQGIISSLEARVPDENKVSLCLVFQTVAQASQMLSIMLAAEVHY
jgi:hypothetical protein